MLPEERQNMIVQLVNEHGAVSVKELSARFAVTDDSIRKDLALLQKNGRLKKTYGGALKIAPDEDHFVSQRKPKYRAEKQRIAKKALKLLHDGETIFLDISTTNIELAKLLKTSGLALTVVTNMVDVMTTMAGDEHNRLIFIGGTSFRQGLPRRRRPRPRAAAGDDVHAGGRDDEGGHPRCERGKLAAARNAQARKDGAICFL